MAEVSSFTAQLRDSAGKGIARALRRQGRIPAIIYGNGMEPVMISLDGKEVSSEISQEGLFTRIIEVQVNGHTHRVLVRDLQLDPVTDRALHMDFMEFGPDTRITVEVPVHFTNEEESVGLTRGGVLNIVRRSVELICSPEKIPQALIFDLAGLDIGATIHISSIELPEGVKLTTDRDFTVATVAAPTIMVVDEGIAEEGEEPQEDVEGEKGGEDEKGGAEATKDEG